MRAVWSSLTVCRQRPSASQPMSATAPWCPPAPDEAPSPGHPCLCTEQRSALLEKVAGKTQDIQSLYRLFCP